MVYAPIKQQLIRACVAIASLSFIIGFRAMPVLAVCPLALLAPLVISQLTPFWTAMAIMINMSLKDAGVLPPLWYIPFQATLLLLGGYFERVILSDYGL